MSDVKVRKTPRLLGRNNDNCLVLTGSKTVLTLSPQIPAGFCGYETRSEIAGLRAHSMDARAYNIESACSQGVNLESGITATSLRASPNMGRQIELRSGLAVHNCRYL